MNGNRRDILLWVLGVVGVISIGSWLAGSQIESPADAAARTSAPRPSPILVPVEERVLSSNVVTRGTARFGLPLPISIAPSGLKSSAGLLTTLPLRNQQLKEGDLMLTASGRPVFVLQGGTPAYRDMRPGSSGEDVRQLEEGLARLGFDPGLVDGAYDQSTSAAVKKWYESSGWEPFGATPEQLAKLHELERFAGEAEKLALAAEGAERAAALSVQAARARALHDNRVVEAELAARRSDQRRLVASEGSATPLAIESERAKAKYADTAAEAELAATIAERALVVLDPRQPETARAAADARLDLARAAAANAELTGEMAVQAAERDVELAVVQLELAEAAVDSAQLAGEQSVQAAIDARTIVQLDATLARRAADRFATDLRDARSMIGVQIPADEVVFVPALPVRIEEVMARVGDASLGPVMSVTDNQLAVDTALPLDVAPLISAGMPVTIDEQALRIKAEGVVSFVADTPGTRGVDGYHIYAEVRVAKTPVRLEGFSVRLTIPIESTDGSVTVVPVSALSLAADGTSRIQLQNEGSLDYFVVEPGLSADGFVEVNGIDGGLKPGQLVVVGYENPEDYSDAE